MRTGHHFDVASLLAVPRRRSAVAKILRGGRVQPSTTEVYHDHCPRVASCRLIA
jgi:hypothetical protein